jgi:hypothetical protein
MQFLVRNDHAKGNKGPDDETTKQTEYFSIAKIVEFRIVLSNSLSLTNLG